MKCTSNNFIDRHLICFRIFDFVLGFKGRDFSQIEAMKGSTEGASLDSDFKHWFSTKIDSNILPQTLFPDNISFNAYQDEHGSRIMHGPKCHVIMNAENSMYHGMRFNAEALKTLIEQYTDF